MIPQCFPDPEHHQVFGNPVVQPERCVDQAIDSFKESNALMMFQSHLLCQFWTGFVEYVFLELGAIRRGGTRGCGCPVQDARFTSPLWHRKWREATVVRKIWRAPS